MTKKTKKLLVSVEKIRDLQSSKLREASGGDSNFSFTNGGGCVGGTWTTCKTTKLICSPSAGA